MGLDRENYFVLLGFDVAKVLAQGDVLESEIKSVIEKKKQDWNFSSATKHMLDMVPEIEKVMLNASSRKAEVKRLRELRNKTMEELKSTIRVSGEMDEKAKKKLFNKNKKYGITINDIEKLLREIGDESGKKKNKVGFISPQDANTIEQNLEKIRQIEATENRTKGTSITMKHNLYDTVGLPVTATAAQMRKKADEEFKRRNESANKDNVKDPIYQIFYGKISKIFTSEASKAEYDHYLSIMKSKEFNDLIDAAADSHKTISSSKQLVLFEEGMRRKVDNTMTYLLDYCEYKGYVIKEEVTICESCGTENKPGISVCEKCKKTLFIVCPNCQKRSGNTQKKCIVCGFDFSIPEQVEKKAKKMRELLNQGDWSNAEHLLREIKGVWNKYSGYEALEKEVDKEKQRYLQKKKEQADSVRRIEQAIKDKEFYKARSIIKEAEILGGGVDAGTKQKVEATINNFENLIKRCKMLGEDESVEILGQICDDIRDSNEVKEMIKRYPPKVSFSLEARQNIDNISVTWSKSVSKGKCIYHLIRKQGSVPVRIGDGEEIYRGENISFTDGSIKENTHYYYGVYVERLGAFSELKVSNNPAVRISPLRDVALMCGNSIIDILWTVADTVTEIEVSVCEANQNPTDNQFKKVNCNRLDGITLKELINGKKYYVRLVAIHTIGGRIYRSIPVIKYGIPSKPATPLENFRIGKEGDKFIASWNVSEWDAAIFMSEKEPEYEVGRQYDYTEITKKYTKVNLALNKKNEGELNVKFTGAKYFIPGAVNGNNIVLGKAVRITDIPMASNGVVEKVVAGNCLYVTFKWGKGIRNAVVLYRNDKYPEGPQDPQAIQIKCTQEMYDSNAGIEITDPNIGDYYVAVYMCIEEKGEISYSQPIEIFFSNQQKMELFYTISYKKMLFGKKCKISVTVYEADRKTFTMPPFLLLTKVGTVPIKKDDGWEVFREGQETMVKGSHTFEGECNDIPKGSFIKLFFEKDTDYSRFSVKNDGSNKI